MVRAGQIKITWQTRPADKSVKSSIISQPQHMLWVLKRTVSMRRFFCTPKTYVQTVQPDG